MFNNIFPDISRRDPRHHFFEHSLYFSLYLTNFPFPFECLYNYVLIELLRHNSVGELSKCLIVCDRKAELKIISIGREL